MEITFRKVSEKKNSCLHTPTPHFDDTNALSEK